MELKNFLRGLLSPIEGFSSITGKQLEPIVTYLESNEPFIGSKIEVIAEIKEVGNPVLVHTNRGLEFLGSKISPKLINVKHVDGIKFNETVRLYSLNLDTIATGEEVLSYRCTPDSINFPQE